jgi:DNA primase
LPGNVPEFVIQQVARSANIVGIIGRHTNLKQRGKKFWGLCPFHKEKTPSFSVDPEMGLYYCFGCKAGGNVFTFLKNVEGLEFYDALVRLAREAGVDLSRYEGARGPSRDKLNRLFEVCELAANFYAKCLQKAAGSERARDYLRRRQISDESVERWKIGYAPDGWEHLVELARNRSVPMEALEQAGLALRRTGAEGLYDRFRNRLMFPVRDKGGKVIAFGARALSDEDQPKYLNSPDTPLFSKGHCFYGICEARDAIRETKTAVIVEGYTDVIMAHQFGFEAVLAVLGTALTEAHARTLKAMCERVILVFDADEAGQKSATRSIEVLLGEDLEVRVASLVSGEDPCDFLLAHGAEAFKERLDASEDFFDFRLRRAREGRDTESVIGRSRAFEELADLALKVQNEARRDMLIRSIAHELGVSERSAWAYIERVWQKPRSRSYGADEQSPTDGRACIYDEGVALQLVGLLLANPGLQKRACEELDVSALRESPERSVLERLLNRSSKHGPQQPAEFVATLEDPALGAAAAAAMAEEEKRAQAARTSAEEIYERYRDDLKGRRERMELDELRRRIATEASPAPNTPSSSQKDRSEWDEDKLLQMYLEKRRREDEKSARLNPNKKAK